MLQKYLLALVVLLAVSASAMAKPIEYYFMFQINNRSELDELTRVISISNVRDNVVFAYANEDELSVFEELGYDYQVLPHPGTLIVPDMAASLDSVTEWDVYPSYDQYESMMYQFEADYPTLCQIYNAGYTVLGHKILFARISADVMTHENEPEVMYSSTMHGDETTGYLLMLRLIDSLLTGYGTDPRITGTIDDLEIWINPLANPDGTYSAGDSTVSGATRYNANYADLNRNFPDPQYGDHPDLREWQPETVAMMNLAGAHNFVISANFHGGAEVVNYPWDTWPRLHPDDDWYQSVCREYADTVQQYGPHNYMTDLDDGITNGYEWYPAYGGRQDYMNYWHGCREVTIELSSTKLIDATELSDYWEWNKVSLLDYLEEARFGIRGVVTDAVTGLPLAATVTVLGHDADSSRVFCERGFGDYHRMIAAGTYDLEFTAQGYYTDTVRGVTVGDHDIAVVNVSLELQTDSHVCGDVDDINNSVDVEDVDYFIDFLFREGPDIPYPPAADVDGSGEVDIQDICYLLDFLYRSGPSLKCNFID